MIFTARIEYRIPLELVDTVYISDRQLKKWEFTIAATMRKANLRCPKYHYTKYPYNCKPSRFNKR